MGVTNLWSLLSPSGRKVKIESLEGKKLAVDMSIWLSQFIYAMKDDNGDPLPNCHVLGTIRRIMKLLYHGIRPVFVFDGAVTPLKVNTVIHRHETREKQANDLKKKAERMLKRQIDSCGGIDNFVKTIESSSSSSSSSKPIDSTADDDVAWEDGDRAQPTKRIDSAPGDDWSVPKLEEGLCLETLSSLPILMRRKITEKAVRDHWQRRRKQFSTSCSGPEEFSKAQVSSFLEWCHINRKMQSKCGSSSGISVDVECAKVDTDDNDGDDDDAQFGDGSGGFIVEHKEEGDDDSVIEIDIGPNASLQSAVVDDDEVELTNNSATWDHHHPPQSSSSSSIDIGRNIESGWNNPITPEMKQEVMELFSLLGLPYITAPFEAEAQCVALERAGIVDGVISEDCDVFLFGASNVYRHLFTENHFVESYTAEDIRLELGLSRNDLIAAALLLGSDYTEGVRGVGIVNASEILEAFGCELSIVNGLNRFKEWLNCEDFQDRSSKKRKMTDPVEKFSCNHASSRLRWSLPSDFPSLQVIDAYINPLIDDRWSKTDFDTAQVEDRQLTTIPIHSGNRIVWKLEMAFRVEKLARFCRSKIGMTIEQIKETLIPVLKRLERYIGKKVKSWENDLARLTIDMKDFISVSNLPIMAISSCTAPDSPSSVEYEELSYLDESRDKNIVPLNQPKIDNVFSSFHGNDRIGHVNSVRLKSALSALSSDKKRKTESLPVRKVRKRIIEDDD